MGKLLYRWTGMAKDLNEYWPTGHCETGQWDTGYCETEHCETKHCETGHCKTGIVKPDTETGPCETGHWTTRHLIIKEPVMAVLACETTRTTTQQKTKNKNVSVSSTADTELKSVLLYWSMDTKSCYWLLRLLSQQANKGSCLAWVGLTFCRLNHERWSRSSLSIRLNKKWACACQTSILLLLLLCFAAEHWGGHPLCAIVHSFG